MDALLGAARTKKSNRDGQMSLPQQAHPLNTSRTEPVTVGCQIAFLASMGSLLRFGGYIRLVTIVGLAVLLSLSSCRSLNPRGNSGGSDGGGPRLGRKNGGCPDGNCRDANPRGPDTDTSCPDGDCKNRSHGNNSTPPLPSNTDSRQTIPDTDERTVIIRHCASCSSREKQAKDIKLALENHFSALRLPPPNIRIVPSDNSEDRGDLRVFVGGDSPRNLVFQHSQGEKDMRDMRDIVAAIQGRLGRPNERSPNDPLTTEALKQTDNRRSEGKRHEITNADERKSPKDGKCPVTGERLGSMGLPVPVTVNGKTIYVCCQGCVETVKKNPEKYFTENTPNRSTPITLNEATQNTKEHCEKCKKPPLLSINELGNNNGNAKPLSDASPMVPKGVSQEKSLSHAKDSGNDRTVAEQSEKFKVIIKYCKKCFEWNMKESKPSDQSPGLPYDKQAIAEVLMKKLIDQKFSVKYTGHSSGLADKSIAENLKPFDDSATDGVKFDDTGESGQMHVWVDGKLVYERNTDLEIDDATNNPEHIFQKVLTALKN